MSWRPRRREVQYPPRRLPKVPVSGNVLGRPYRTSGRPSMLRFRFAKYLVAALSAGLIFLGGPPGQPFKLPPPKKPSNEIIQEFPSNEQMQTAGRSAGRRPAATA